MQLLRVVLIVTTILVVVSGQTANPNVFEMTLDLSSPSTNIVFSNSQYAGFEGDVAATFQALDSQSVMNSECYFSFRNVTPTTTRSTTTIVTTSATSVSESSTTTGVNGTSTFTSTSTSRPTTTTTTQTPTTRPPGSRIICTVVALVKASTTSIYPTYQLLTTLSANVSSQFFTDSVLWPLRSSLAYRFDLDNSQLKALSMPLSAPCRGPLLTNPATPAPGDPMKCNGTKGQVSSFSLVIVYYSDTNVQSAVNYVCSALLMENAMCAQYVSGTQVSVNDARKFLVTVKGQANPVSVAMAVLKTVRDENPLRIWRVGLLPYVGAPVSSEVPLFDKTLEDRIFVGFTLKCGLSEFIWVLCFIILVPVAYIVLWTAYRCGRTRGKKKLLKRYAIANKEEGDQAMAAMASATAANPTLSMGAGMGMGRGGPMGMGFGMGGPMGMMGMGGPSGALAGPPGFYPQGYSGNMTPQQIAMMQQMIQNGGTPSTGAGMFPGYAQSPALGGAGGQNYASPHQASLGGMGYGMYGQSAPWMFGTPQAQPQQSQR